MKVIAGVFLALRTSHGTGFQPMGIHGTMIRQKRNNECFELRLLKHMRHGVCTRALSPSAPPVFLISSIVCLLITYLPFRCVEARGFT